MATANYVLIEKVTVGAAGASSISFSGIPQTGYTDLVLKMSVRTDRASTDDLLNFNFNGLSSNQSSRNLQGNGSAASSGTYGSNLYLAWVDAASNTASTFGNAEMYIPNYTSSNFKSVSTDGVLENNASTAVMGMTAGLWSSTAAITSIAITSVFSANFVQYSTFYLYGVAKLGTTPAIVPYATGGDTIMTDGTYWYHAFKASGTFTPAKGLTCDVLTVAGGGGGGGGGGGAGGLLYSATQSIATAQTVTIGAGGVASGSKGTNSSVGSLIASGGGAGDSNLNGGSGGGSSANTAGGTATAGQGNNGGAGITFVTNCGFGGGGGAGAVGGAGTTTTGGVGGAGTNTYSTWLNTTGTGVSGYIAGGGGGGCGTGTPGLGPNAGAGGAGGGAQAGVYVAGANGVANTGGGGGGSYGTNGGNGGSGLVIVRYAV